ncbi:MAG: CoA-binding protein [Nitrospinota bacterium]
MHKEGIKGFPYYVGIDSLAQIATAEDRVCVLNMLGNESRGVTPVSHTFSGGNVVFGTGPGRSGQVLKTAKGNIPVYNSVKEGVEAGHTFNTGVVYLPPSAVKDGVAELVRYNPDLKKIVILTEKVSVKDSREIRSICQTNGIDVFGGNCLGVADSWNHVRIGGALGGNSPEESLVKGSIALYSNSGNFTTTIAVYLTTAGWGTTTSVSSGKDVYIHFAAKEFFHALDNDDRSKGAVAYVEPGGYYEHGLEITKPTVACIVGRWKSELTKACGHAGSLAGSGDDAKAKEKWFMDYFGVDSIYSPENPVVSKKGAVVTNIAHIPEAMTKVMDLNKIKPDFEPKGDLSLKCWFANDQGLSLPKELDLEPVEPLAPYNEQVKHINLQVGAQFPRQGMKDTSGVSFMDSKTQVSRIQNVSILDASEKSVEENIVLSLIKSYPEDAGRKLANIALNAYVNMHGEVGLLAADAAREAGSSPNVVLSSAIAIVGKKKAQKAIDISELIVDTFKHKGINNGFGDFDFSEQLAGLTNDHKTLLAAEAGDKLAPIMLAAINKIGDRAVFIEFVKKASGGKPSSSAMLGAIWATISWGALVKNKISKATFVSLPWYSLLFSAMVGSSVSNDSHTETSFKGIKNVEIVEEWSFTETIFLSVMGRRPTKAELVEFSCLLGLIITNGPGTISAQGAKGAVSADGPQVTDRVQINKGFIGFLTHTGFAHGGNGYEAMAFLMEIFKGTTLKDPGNKEHGIDLKEIANIYAKSYGAYKKKEKETGNIEYDKIPCINHPVFKGKDINYDPREQFVTELFEKSGNYNIFLDFYHELVQALFANKVSPNVYCVNVDAVIAVILLKMFWPMIKANKVSDSDVESSAFTTFLYGRMMGCAAEIDDHLNRGRNMDTRTPASQCTYVG